MQIQGTIEKILPMQTGVSKNGNNWASQTYILEYDHSLTPKQLAFDIMGEASIAQANITQGELLTVELTIRCNEYNGRYYNKVFATNVIHNSQQLPQQPQPQPVVVRATDPVSPPPYAEEPSLPF